MKYIKLFTGTRRLRSMGSTTTNGKNHVFPIDSCTPTETYCIYIIIYKIYNVICLLSLVLMFWYLQTLMDLVLYIVKIMVNFCGNKHMTSALQVKLPQISTYKKCILYLTIASCMWIRDELWALLMIPPHICFKYYE